jgi:monoamine oxidase
VTVSERHDVVVVGAGLSGLHAANLLQDQGFDVLVVEAQTRIGGRIHSMRQLGSNAEAGGTYIGAGYRRIFEAAARFGIQLIDVTPILEFFREQDFVLDGEFIRQSEWAEHPANAFPDEYKSTMPWNFHRVLTMRENPLAAPEDWLDPAHAALDVSLHDWMRSLGLSDRAIELGYGINSSFGADAHEVSALMILFRAAFSKAQRAQAPKDSLGFTVKDGVQRIPEAMASALEHEVRLGHAVDAIDLGADGARLHCANGARLTAKHVVCSIPFGALRRVSLSPALDGPQGAAVDQLEAQPLTQVYLAAQSEFWRIDGYAPSLFTNSPAGMIAAGRSGDDPSHITHLTAWVMGTHAAALDRLPAEDAGRSVIATIEALRPAAKGQLETISLQSWGADPYAGGAWAYFRPGQVRAFARAMGAAHEGMHFCGEHLGIANRGMEAAMESAERVVAEIIGV